MSNKKQILELSKQLQPGQKLVVCTNFGKFYGQLSEHTNDNFTLTNERGMACMIRWADVRGVFVSVKEGQR